MDDEARPAAQEPSVGERVAPAEPRPPARRRGLTDIPSWITAIGGAVAALSASVFGLVQILRDDPRSTDAAKESTTTSSVVAATTTTTVGAPIFVNASDGVITFRAPMTWSQQRSYELTEFRRTTAGVAAHALVSATDMRTDDTWWAASGFYASAIDEAEFVATLYGSGDGPDIDSLRTFLASEVPWNLECDPTVSELRWTMNGLRGLLRQWRKCGPSGDREMVDGLLFDAGHTVMVYLQLRPGDDDLDLLLDEVIGSLSVDGTALASSLSSAR